MGTALAYAALVGCTAWFVRAGLLATHLARLHRVAERAPARRPPAQRDEWPRVSTIVPAKDEERAVGPALRSRLDDDYPDLEIVVVDDRSTDATAERVAEVAASDDRVTLVRIDTLPDGWLGKTHALARGIERADGEWLLVSDADIGLAPGGLRKAVDHCETDGLDFLALVPEFRSHSSAVDVVWTVLMRTLGTLIDPAAVRDPEARTAMGSGGFMLVRRSALERTPGYEHLRMETTDDVALGAMMKRSGARCDFADGRGIARVSIYDDLGGFFRGVEKNGGALVHAPLAGVVGFVVLAAYFETAPLLALASGVGWARWMGAASGLVATLSAVASLRRNTGMVLPALLWPVGSALLGAAILRSAWLLHRRGGVVWRDTFYPREQLLEGQRFRIV